jgi:hypothetical protein
MPTFSFLVKCPQFQWALCFCHRSLHFNRKINMVSKKPDFGGDDTSKAVLQQMPYPCLVPNFIWGTKELLQRNRNQTQH